MSLLVMILRQKRVREGHNVSRYNITFSHTMIAQNCLQLQTLERQTMKYFETASIISVLERY